MLFTSVGCRIFARAAAADFLGCDAGAGGAVVDRPVGSVFGPAGRPAVGARGRPPVPGSAAPSGRRWRSGAAELVFDVAGTAGVYLLAQACVVIAYCAVFALARALVGIHHAVFAILLMAGISTFAAPTPDFGPAILAMPLWAFAILNLWRAIGEQRRSAWVRLGFQLGLLLLTSYAGLALVAALAVFLVATRHGRQALGTRGPWIATILMLAVASPYLLWLRLAGWSAVGAVCAGDRPAGAAAYLARLAGVGEALAPRPCGASGAGGASAGNGGAAAPRPPRCSGGNRCTIWRAGSCFSFSSHRCASRPLSPSGPVRSKRPDTFTPFVLLSGLVVVMLAGDAIAWHRASLTAMVWSLLLVVPPLAAAASIVALPWLGISGVEVARPAAAMGRFVAGNFQRRTGLPLTIVSGDPRTAALVALGAPTRPSLYLDAAPRLTPWVTAARYPAQGRGRGVAQRRHPRRCAARHRGTFSRTGRRRAARTSRAGSRDACRPYGSAGAWCARRPPRPQLRRANRPNRSAQPAPVTAPTAPALA